MMNFQSFVQKTVRVLFSYCYSIEQRSKTLHFFLEPWGIFESLLLNYLILKRTLLSTMSLPPEAITILEYIEQFSAMKKPFEIYLISILISNTILLVLLVLSKEGRKSMSSTCTKLYEFLFLLHRTFLFSTFSQLYYVIRYSNEYHVALKGYMIVFYLPLVVNVFVLVIESKNSSVFGVFQPFLPLLYLVDPDNNIPLFASIAVYSAYSYFQQQKLIYRTCQLLTLITIFFAVVWRIQGVAQSVELSIFVITFSVFAVGFILNLAKLSEADPENLVSECEPFVYGKKELKQDSHDEFFFETCVIDFYLSPHLEEKDLEPMRHNIPVGRYGREEYLQMLILYSTMNLNEGRGYEYQCLRYKYQLEDEGLRYELFLEVSGEYERKRMNVCEKYRAYKVFCEVEKMYARFKGELDYVGDSLFLDSQITRLYNGGMEVLERMLRIWRNLGSEKILFEDVENELSKTIALKQEISATFNSLCDRFRWGKQFALMLKMLSILEVDFKNTQGGVGSVGSAKHEEYYPFLIVHNDKIQYTSFKFNQLFKFHKRQVLGCDVEVIFPRSLRRKIIKGRYSFGVKLATETVVVVDGDGYMHVVDVTVSLMPFEAGTVSYIVHFVKTHYENKLLFLYSPTQNIDCCSSSLVSYFKLSPRFPLLKSMIHEIDLSCKETVSDLRKNMALQGKLCGYDSSPQTSTPITLQRLNFPSLDLKNSLLLEVTKQDGEKGSKNRWSSYRRSNCVQNSHLGRDYIGGESEEGDSVELYTNRLLTKREELNKEGQVKGRYPFMVGVVVGLVMMVGSIVAVVGCYSVIDDELRSNTKSIEIIEKENELLADMLYECYYEYQKQVVRPDDDENSQLEMLYPSRYHESIREFQSLYLSSFFDVSLSSSRTPLIFPTYNLTYLLNETYLMNFIYHASSATLESLQFVIANYDSVKNIRGNLLVLEEVNQKFEPIVVALGLVVSFAVVLVGLGVGLVGYLWRCGEVWRDVAGLWVGVGGREIGEGVGGVEENRREFERACENEGEEWSFRESLGSLEQLMRNNRGREAKEKRCRKQGQTPHPTSRKMVLFPKCPAAIWKTGLLFLTSLTLLSIAAPYLIHQQTSMKKILEFQRKMYWQILDIKNHLVETYHHILESNPQTRAISNSFVNTLLLSSSLLPQEFSTINFWKLLNQDLCDRTKEQPVPNFCEQALDGVFNEGLSKSLESYISSLNNLRSRTVNDKELLREFKEYKVVQMYIMGRIEEIEDEFGECLRVYMADIYEEKMKFLGLGIILIIMYLGCVRGIYVDILRRIGVARGLFNLVPVELFGEPEVRGRIEEKRIIERLIGL